MSFEQLVHVSKLGHAGFPHNLLVFEWQQKRQHLAVYLMDLPNLAAECKNADKNPYESNPAIALVDPIPKIRLASACEAATNCLYGMAEIAAQFANKASLGLLPARFNRLRERAERGDFPAISKWVTDFGWYKKVRELRTEWVHHSTIFVGEEKDGEAILVVRCHRRPTDRIEFPQEIQVRIAALVDWIHRSIVVIDSFGNYLLAEHILPKLDIRAKVTTVKRDASGWPVIRPDNRFEVEEITIAEYLAQCGLREAH